MDELEIIAHKRIDGLTVFVDALTYRTPHVHPEWEVLWLLEGTLQVSGGSKGWTMAPGEIAVFPPDDPHELRAPRGCTFLCLQISEKWLPGTKRLRLDACRTQEHLSEVSARTVRWWLWDIAHDYFDAQGQYALSCLGRSCMVMKTLLEELPCHIMSPEETAGLQRKNARLQRLIRYVDENFKNKVSLSEFARQEDCTVGYLSHFVRQAMHQTFQEYVESVRFHYACQRIAAGQRKMLDVCMEAGFSDYRYFSRAFKSRCGMTPEEFCRREGKKLQVDTVQRGGLSAERIYPPREALAILEQLTKAQIKGRG